MNLVEALLKEHSAAQKNKIVEYIGNNPGRFARLVGVFLKGPYRVTQRAAWPLSYCVEKHPGLIRPHLKAILKNLLTRGAHAAVKRNTLRLMQFISIPKGLQGMAAEACFKMLADRREPIAVRVFAMTVLGNIALAEPALKNEIILIIEDQLPSASAGFLSRSKKVLGLLKD